MRDTEKGRQEQKSEEEKKKWPIPRGAAATKAKNEYIRRHYDRAEMILPRGAKAKIEMAAKRRGMSRNEYVLAAVKEAYQKDMGEELLQKEE